MSQCDQDFTVYLGRDSAPIFTVVGSDGTPVNLSTVEEIGWDCQEDLSSQALITKLKSTGGIVFVTDGTDGKFQLNLAAADYASLSGFYLHEAWIKDSAGSQTEVATGRMRVGRAPAWSYSGDPSLSAKDGVRFLVGDTNNKDQQCSDGEVLFAIAQTSSLYSASAMVCRAIASKYAREVDSVQNELRTMWSSRQKAYSDLAKQLDVKASGSTFAAPYAGGISIADKRAQELNTDRVPPQFNLGMEDNYLPVGPAGNEPMLRGQC